MQVPFSLPTFTLKKYLYSTETSIKRTRALNLTFMVISVVRNLYQLERTLQREYMIIFVHVLVDRSFKFANKLSYCLILPCKPSHDSINIDTVTVRIL